MFKGAWGYRNDGDAGLSHVGARYYDAQVGRFITRDTYLDQHPYLYCEHDPINLADPSGHYSCLSQMESWGKLPVGPGVRGPVAGAIAGGITYIVIVGAATISLPATGGVMIVVGVVAGAGTALSYSVISDPQIPPKALQDNVVGGAIGGGVSGGATGTKLVPALEALVKKIFGLP